MKLGNIKIDVPLFLAPMAGISNHSFRQICKNMGAGIVFAEMVSDKAIIYKNKKTIDLLKYSDDERPIAQQIFGSDKDTIVEAAKFIDQYMKPDIIDINMGCPVPKVALRAQAGAALLKNPERIEEIVRAVVQNVEAIVSVKLRLGWDQNSINVVEIAKRIERAGAKMITIHGRTRSQGYSGKVNWDIIKRVKEEVNIIVVGNGDIKTIDDIIEKKKYTNVDAIMIGRGALENPFIFKEYKHYLETGEKIKFNDLEKLNVAIKHFLSLIEDKGEKIAIFDMRGHMAYYLKNMPNSKKIKEKINKALKKEELITIIEEYKKELLDIN